MKTNDLYYGSLPQNQHELRTDNIRVFFQARNQGMGAALLRAFQEARGEIVIVQDADLEYDPQDYFGLIAPIERGLADAPDAILPSDLFPSGVPCAITCSIV